jgi:hypothetical protein
MEWVDAVKKRVVIVRANTRANFHRIIARTFKESVLVVDNLASVTPGLDERTSKLEHIRDF